MDSDTFPRRSVLWLALACVLATMVVALSLSSTIVELPGDTGGGRYAHLLAYAALMFTFARACTTMRARLLTAVALLALGVCLEFVQGWTGYRNYERADMAANAAGIVLGWLAVRTVGMWDTQRTVSIR